jgi:predicted nucleic-acid-binding protein
MIGLDTNVLVRYIAQDDSKQSPLATKLIEALTASRPGFVTTVVLVELVWVMQRCYASSKDEIVAILDRLVRSDELLLEHPAAAFEALDVYSRSNADFADCLIERSARKAGCVHTVTFDRRAAKIDGMQFLR